jgi:iron complex outermembrane receptor protein
MKRTAIALAVSALPFAAIAQETQLNEVQVTSTTIDDRFHSKRAEASTTHDISGKTVDEKRPENMMQILQSIPGVTADVSSGDEIKIKLRGIENQRYMGEKPGVAIVIDGVPVFERTGKVNVDLDNIESIKVIKGGASYLFGDDALSGAVIITTKRGAAYKGVTIGADVGSWGYDRELLRAGLGGDWGTGHLQATHRQNDDWYWQAGYKTDYIDGNARLYLTDKSDITFGFEKSDRQKDKHGSVTGAIQAANDPRGTIGRDYARKFDVDLQKIHATYSNDLADKSNVLAMVYEYRDHTMFWSGPQRYTVTGVVVPNSAQDAYTTLNDYHQVQRGAKSEWRGATDAAAWLLGGDIRRNEYTNYNTAKVSYCTSVSRTTGACTASTAAGTVLGNNRTDEAVNAVYGELKFAPAPRWTLTGNGRYDNIKLDYHSGVTKELATPFDRSKSFNVTSWRAGTAYAVTDRDDIYGNVSTGFRAPTADQLYNGSISPTGGKTENNENLKPEQSLNLELGVRSKSALFGVAIDTEAAVFQIDRKDYIMSTVGQYAAGTTTYQEMYDNIGGVRNRGFELALHTDRKLDYTLDMAYTYIQAKFTKYDTFFQALGDTYRSPTYVRFNNTGHTVPRVARHQLDTTFGWQGVEHLRIALEMDARSWSWADEINRVKLPGRTIFTLHGNYDIKGPGPFAIGTKWSFFTRIDNLFNRTYWSTARGTNDSGNYLTGLPDNVYNENDPSIVVGKPRGWTVGVMATF